MIEHTADARALGIDEQLVSELVDHFYARIRDDARLGPIFDGAIGEGWDAHLDRMKLFWSAVALKAGGFSGNPTAVHRRLDGVVPEDFDRWLRLFEETLVELGVTDEILGFFLERARTIAQSLKLAMFGFRGQVTRTLPTF